MAGENVRDLRREKGHDAAGDALHVGAGGRTQARDNGSQDRKSQDRGHDDRPTLRPPGLIGSDPATRRMLEDAAVAAGHDAPLLLVGESGTGKDMLAAAIHAASAFANGAFVTFNASGLPDDILDRELFGASGPSAPPAYPSVPRFLAAAQGGTLYIDDLCRTSPQLQSRLLQLLRDESYVTEDGERRPFSARIISATNVPVAQSLHQGRLRRDLYDLLSSGLLNLPPLRERQGTALDIAVTVYPRLLARAGHPAAPLPEAMLHRLASLPWPGNVRELLNVLRRMALSPEAADGRVPAIPADVLAEGGEAAPTDTDEPATFAEIERRAILAAIARNNGSVQRAADELELAASTLYRKLKSWNEA